MNLQLHRAKRDQYVFVWRMCQQTWLGWDKERCSRFSSAFEDELERPPSLFLFHDTPMSKIYPLLWVEGVKGDKRTSRKWVISHLDEKFGYLNSVMPHMHVPWEAIGNLLRNELDTLGLLAVQQGVETMYEKNLISGKGV